MKNESFGPESSKIEDIIDWTLLWSGVVLAVLGIVGAILIISGHRMMSDLVLQFSFSFVTFYMLFFGLFLMVVHKKIVIKPKPRR